MLKTKADELTGTKILLDAISNDKVHLARFVLDALDGGIVDSQTDGAQTPLISSILLPDGQARCKFIELLLQKGAGVNCQDANGRTALSYACEKGYLDAVKTLVQHGADPEVGDSWGNTSLMYAAAAGHSSVVEFLVRAFKRLGLRLDRQNKAGNSAVEVAKFLGHQQCVSALTNISNRSREADGRAHGDAQPPESLGTLADKLDVLQTSDGAQGVQNSVWQTKPWMKQNRFRSMDSIVEFRGEDSGSFLSPKELVFSGALTPVPPPRTCTQNSQQLKPEERPNTSVDHFPSLVQTRGVPKSLFFSPQPNRTPSGPNAPSVLGVLLTPISRKHQTDGEKEKHLAVCKLNDSYYRKRSSLPTGVLNPAPPERAPVRKSRTGWRRGEPPCTAAPPDLTTPAAASATTSFSLLSNKLFRRFTAPDFKNNLKDLEQDHVLISNRIPRSETFPQAARHPQVDSTLSIDSISSVKCEFDFQFRNTNSSK